MVEIRLAKPEDGAAVLAFYETVIDELAATRETPIWKKGVYPEAVYLNRVIALQELYLMLEDDRILAAVVLNHKSEPEFAKAAWCVDAPPDQVLVVHTLATLPDRHRTGLASRMMDFAAELGRSKGCKAIRLDVWEPNKPAHAFYQKNGFSARETMQMCYVDTGLSNFVLYERLLEEN